MIRINNVTFSYKNSDTEVLKNYSLEIGNAERVHITGASGCGKTTLLRLIMGLEKATKGSVELSRGARISAVFQENRLIPTLTLLENVSLFSDEKTARELLSALGLDDVLDSLPSAVSGGQKRRAAIARALARPSDILILDEAFTGLDEENKKRACELINKKAAKRVVIIVTHDKEDAQRLGAREIALI